MQRFFQFPQILHISDSVLFISSFIFIRWIDYEIHFAINDNLPKNELHLRIADNVRKNIDFKL